MQQEGFSWAEEVLLKVAGVAAAFRQETRWSAEAALDLGRSAPKDADASTPWRRVVETDQIHLAGR
jgi:hypothetical protein